MNASRFDPRWLAEYRYGLVDATMRDEVPAHCEQAIIAPRFLGGDTGRCPVLVSLQVTAPRELAEVCKSLDDPIQQREDALCSLLLASTNSLETLAARLARRISVDLEAGGPPKQFRFFDPGTFLQLPGLLGESGMAWLLDGIDAVLVPWAGHWTRYETPKSESRFRLTGEHIQSILRVGVVNRVAAQLDPPADATAWTLRCEAIDRHVRRAQLAHGLHTQDDLVAFASHATAYHPEFDRHSRIRDLLRVLREADADAELDYREVTAALTPDDWLAVARDLSATSATQGSAP